MYKAGREGVQISTINDRIKEVRQHLSISQEGLGKILGISRSGVADIESGRRKVNQKHIIMLTNNGISEHWLRTGEGEMLQEMNLDEELMSWAGKTLAQADDSTQKKFVKVLMQLSEEEMEHFVGFAKKLSKEFSECEDTGEDKEKDQA